MTEGLGQTGGGEPITEELLEQLTAQAEEGFDVEEILRRRGRRSPPGAAQGDLADAHPSPTAVPIVPPND
jgi:hypothetical protein